MCQPYIESATALSDYSLIEHWSSQTDGACLNYLPNEKLKTCI